MTRTLRWQVTAVKEGPAREAEIRNQEFRILNACHGRRILNSEFLIPDYTCQLFAFFAAFFGLGPPRNVSR